MNHDDERMKLILPSKQDYMANTSFPKTTVNLNSLVNSNMGSSILVGGAALPNMDKKHNNFAGVTSGANILPYNA